jgi:nucleotide-binding universal stress UspA family protein
MRTADTAPVVVGVNGSAASLAAVRLAGREAVARQRELRVVHAFAWPGYDASAEGVQYDVLRRSAQEVLARAVATATRCAPTARVAGYLVDGLPSRVLLDQSRTAGLLVLGDDDLSTTVRLPTDSVLVQVVARARCPVLVARGVGPPGGPVVAGADGSPASVLALHHAVVEAARRHAVVQVVHVAEPLDGSGEAEARGRQVLDAAVAAVPGLDPAHARLMTGEPAAALVRASAHAQLLVVGRRGDSPALGNLLGAVAQKLLRRASCPTVFVPGSAAAPTR